MEYHVILIEYGKPTHHWVYPYAEDALAQLGKLLIAFQEVNEVSATLIKAEQNDRRSCSELILTQIDRPDFDLD